jgi:predicted acylesterase/phospholipase RssA
MTDYSRAAYRCDIVMKGGITSGVVYPGAICALAEEFRFKNIGGTSAGAIAAAMAAAAETGRSTSRGFRALDELPKKLCEVVAKDQSTRLFHFFQPTSETKPLFDIVTAALGRSGFGMLSSVAGAAVKAYFVRFCVGFFIVVVFAGIFGLGRSMSIGGAMAWIMLAIGAGALAIGFGIWTTIRGDLPRNGFGICSGMNGADRTGAPALTPWLAEALNDAAGRSIDDPPITFGDLWGTPDPKAPRVVNLEMMTTSLTLGRPFRFPLDEEWIIDRKSASEHGRRLKPSHTFYFSPTEMRRYFPETIVAWLREKSRPANFENHASSSSVPLDLRFLPAMSDLPVVFAVRFSLSFPVLLSAVPLWAIDQARKRDAAAPLSPERVWFSDGGIVSNFPVHFFEKTLPDWPAFGINLVEKHPDYPAGVWMPKTNRGGFFDRWIRFDRDVEGRATPIIGFLGAIMNAMQNWTDNLQTALPGFRDRIATVSLTPLEGGLNLNMAPSTIEALSRRGREAGEMLRGRFGSRREGEMNWENHRHIRLRTGLAAIEEFLARLESTPGDLEPGDRDYLDLLIAEPPPSYDWSNHSQRESAADLLSALRERARAIARSIALGEKTLRDGAPRPIPEFKLRPRV